MPLSPNQGLLDEVNAAGSWRHVRKTKPIWVRRLERAEAIETMEGRVQAAAGDFLCRGAAGELWPQDARSLTDRYTATHEVDAAGWRKYEPQPDAEGALAAPVAHPFTVVATWGRLTGKVGDYLLKSYADSATLYPADVWVVDQGLFRATYEKAGPG